MFKLLQAVFITLMVAACSTSGSINTSKNTSTDLGSFIVEGTGAKFEDAKADGFRKAIELAVGVAILSERESVNNKMAKQYILSHSSGYVENFSILDTQVVGTNPAKYKVMMRVEVKPTLVDDYVLYRSKDAKDIDGQRAAANVSTYNNSVETGNNMLLAVLNDFPEKAYTVEVLPIEVFTSSSGKPSINVLYRFSYSDKYLRSLGQVLDKVKDSDCVWFCAGHGFALDYYEDPSDLLPKHKFFYFNEDTKVKLIHNELYGKTDNDGHRFVVKVDFLDSAGNVLATSCHFPESSKFGNTTNKLSSAKKYNIRPEEPEGFSRQINDPRSTLISSLSRVEVNVVKLYKCTRR